MATEIIVTAERGLYDDAEWANLLDGTERIIRCADCKNYLDDMRGDRFCAVWSRSSKVCPPEGYCHRAEARRG